MLLRWLYLYRLVQLFAEMVVTAQFSSFSYYLDLDMI